MDDSFWKLAGLIIIPLGLGALIILGLLTYHVVTDNWIG